MKLSKKDRDLIRQAKALVNVQKVRGGVLGEVGCVLESAKGNKFKGVCLDLYCGIGFCAEHTAIASMVTETKETQVKTIVTATGKSVIPPCGRCRELLSLLDKKNFSTKIIVSENKKVALKELLPSAWEIK